MTLVEALKETVLADHGPWSLKALTEAVRLKVEGKCSQAAIKAAIAELPEAGYSVLKDVSGESAVYLFNKKPAPPARPITFNLQGTTTGRTQAETPNVSGNRTANSYLDSLKGI